MLRRAHRSLTQDCRNARGVEEIHPFVARGRPRGCRSGPSALLVLSLTAREHLHQHLQGMSSGQTLLIPCPTQQTTYLPAPTGNTINIPTQPRGEGQIRGPDLYFLNPPRERYIGTLCIPHYYIPD